MAINKSRIPNAKTRLELESANEAADILDKQQEAGVPQSMMGETGMDRNGRVIDVTGWSDEKKWWAQDRQDTARELGGFKSFGDKSAFDTKNAIRKLQGLPPLDADPVTQFSKDLDRSMTFLDKSALLTPEGKQRALKAGVAAGLSFEAADAAVQNAFDVLNKKYGKKDTAGTPSVGVPPLLARPEEVTPPPSTAATTTQLPEPTTKATTPPREFGAADLGQDVLNSVGLKEFPKGSEEAVRGAYDALRNLGRTPRVTEEERKKFEDLESKFKIEPEKYKADFDKMQYDIKTREDLYGKYDAARNKLIENINPYVSATEATPEPPSPTGRGMGYQPIKSRKEDTIEKVNEALRKRRMQQQYGPQ
jgi:hypothetical protein